MNPLGVECLNCKEMVYVPLENGDLVEDRTTEGFEVTCKYCGIIFSFDVYVDVMNKEIKE